MSAKYTLKEVHVEVNPGVTVIANVSSMDGIVSLLDDLKARNLVAKVENKKSTGEQDRKGKQDSHVNDSPGGRIETNAGIDKGSLVAKNILAFKDGIPQLLRPGAFGNVTDAALVLLHAIETGLKNQSIEYESFKGLYESQNLKSGTPLSMLMTNLRNAGYLDKTTYSKERRLRLTARGDKKAVEIMKGLVSQE
jgi:hypothetical protein